MISNTFPTRPAVTLAARAWAHLMPLARGAVAPKRFELSVELRESTPDPLHESPMTASETSLSGYVRALAASDDRLVGLPVFLMRAFRHRCFLVRGHSDLSRLEDLQGLTVGATGWPDSGNTWTRSLLRRAGVGLDEVKWLLGPLHGGRLEPARIGPLPSNVALAPSGRPLLDALAAGEVDAVMAPFIPRGTHTEGGPVRHLLPDYQAAESAYFAEVGFVPGIHILTLPRDLAVQYPWLPEELVASLQQSKDIWQVERWHYADTTPWMLRDLQRTDRAVGPEWMPYGVAENADMVAAFSAELVEQHLVPGPVDPESVFAIYQRLTDHERT